MSWQVQPGISTTWNEQDLKYELENLLTQQELDNAFSFQIVKINKTKFAMLYAIDSGTYGIVKLYEYTDELKELDSLQIPYEDMGNLAACLIDSTHLMLSFNSNKPSYITTIKFDDDVLEILDTLKHEDWEGGGYDSLLQVDSTHFILASNEFDLGYKSRIKTFSIDSSYNITLVDTLENGDGGSSNSLVKVDDTHYMLAYESDSDYTATMKVLALNESYEISVVSTLTIDDTSGDYFSLVDVNVKFVLAYDASGQGVLKVYTVDESYNITEKNSFVYSEIGGYNNALEVANDEYFLLEYLDDEKGLIKAFKLDEYSISQIDTLNVGGDYGDITKIRPGIYSVGYWGTDYLESYSNIIQFIVDENIWTEKDNVTTTWTEV